ncbi:MAG: efflux RND transporter permease subunit [Gammaproteobacteria bacterium]
MNGIIAWFAENRVAANLLMVVILVAGALSLKGTGKELIPHIALDVMIINTAYPGASPEEVERVVTDRIERAVGDLPGIISMRSFSRDQLSVVSLEISADVDPGDMRESINSRLDGIHNWPEAVSTPKVGQVAVRRDLVTNLVLYGDADERALKVLANRVKQELLDSTGITQVDISNVRPYEMTVEVSELALQRYAIPFAEIVTAIKRQTTDHVSGEVSLPGGSSSILARGETLDLPRLEDLPIRSLPDGGQVLLQDIAWVRDGFENSRASTVFNGKNAVYISVYRVGSQDILKIAATVNQFVDMLGDELPAGIQVGIWQDVAQHYVSRIELLRDNAISGMTILFVILLIFLNMRLSFWVSLGVPIAFMGAFWLLPVFDNTINMVSMFAFILVLGIVVDDAIIVGENVYSHQTRGGRPGLAGAISGTQEVAKPVIFAVLTTMVMFTPMLFLPSNEGKLMRVIPTVVLAILAFSLLESLLILPAHLSSSDESNPFSRNRWLNLSGISDALEAVAFKFYRPVLGLCLRWRYAVIALFVSIFVVSLAVLSGGWVKLTYFSAIPSDSVILDVTYPRGTTYETIVREIDRFMTAAQSVTRDIERETGQPVLKNIVSMYGQNSLQKSDNIGAVVLEMVPSDARLVSGEDIVARWRDKIGSQYLASGLEFETTLNKKSPQIDVELLSRDPDMLEHAMRALKDRVADFQGIYDLQDDNEKGKLDVHLTARPLAIELGLKNSDLAVQVGQVFHGVEATTFTRSNEDVSVSLRYPRQDDELWHLENMLVALPDGSVAPLHMLADVQIQRGPHAIRRTSGMRSLRVSAYVDEAVGDEAVIMRTLRKEFLQNIATTFPGVRWENSGMQQGKKRFMDALLTGFILALLVMYGLVATLFRSYLQPILILFAVPFGLIGAMVGHVILGKELTLWSLVGITAVSGVVVNDNLVLIDCINQMRWRGESVMSAVREAGVVRFRPIILTTVTTFGGLFPMMTEQSVQAQFMIPMAVSLGYGVLFATFISLVLVPAAYLMMEDFKSLFGVRASEPTEIKSTAVQSAVVKPGDADSNPSVSSKNMTPEVTIPFVVPAVVPAVEPVVEPAVAPTLVPPPATPPPATPPPTRTPTKQANQAPSVSMQAYQSGYAAGWRQQQKMFPPRLPQALRGPWEAGWQAGVKARVLNVDRKARVPQAPRTPSGFNAPSNTKS